MVGHIPNIGISNPLPHGIVPETLQRCDRSRRQIQKLVVRMKAREVDWDIRADFSSDPVHQSMEHCLGIVQGWDNKVYDLKVDSASGNLPDGVENRLKLGAADIPVKIRAKTLQIDLYCIQQPAQFGQRRGLHESAADHDAPQFLFSCQSRGVGQVLDEDSRLVVGESDHGCASGFCAIDQFERSDERNVEVFRPGLGYFPILAKLAVEWTSGGSKRKCIRSGKKMIERLFFYGVYVDSNRPSIYKAAQFTIHIHSGSAFSSVPALQHASLGTQKTLDECRFAVMCARPEFGCRVMARDACGSGRC
jgi:hypothetical protein